MITTKSGVYCLRNVHNNKIYIGSSLSLRQRYTKHKSKFNRGSKKKTAILDKVYNKYKFEDFEFQILMITEDYLEWETLLIKLLNPEYNTAGMVSGKLQPNLGKKFNKEWIEKITNSTPHSEKVKKHLTKINKQNACKVIFEKENEKLVFSSWVEGSEHFNHPCGVSCFTKTKRNNKFYWKGWLITQLSKQKKQVKLISKTETKIFNSAAKVDRYLNLWKGATSHAIKNRNGQLHGNIVEYI